jgi:hypothetical protein
VRRPWTDGTRGRRADGGAVFRRRLETIPAVFGPKELVEENLREYA